MPTNQKRSPARILAPAALAAVTLIVLLILFSAGSGDTNSPNKSSTADESAATTKKKTSTAPRRPRASSSYTVKAGDTLGSIAQKSGVPVTTLQELNPQLDPQALVSGQKIKLR